MMARRFGAAAGAVVCISSFTIGLWLLPGCDKSSSSSTPVAANNELIVALGPPDINENGAIKDTGLARIKAAGDKGNLSVRIVHVPLTDAALEQLAQFKNLRHLMAPGSHFSPAAMNKLKAAIPEVEVGTK
jgi:hypothetical protein